MRKLQTVRSRPATTLMLTAVETLARLRGDTQPLVPPPELRFVGGGDYETIGQEFRQHFIELGGLRPEHDVLDVGCGVGRMAVPLLDYLTGRYEGFDVVPLGIAWSRKHISRLNPRLRFQVADVRNAKYNPGGARTAAEYRFPYPDSSFDFVFMVSVLTHLLDADASNYLSESSRILRPGGTCFATFFVLDDRDRADASLDFVTPAGDCWTVNAETPEEAVAYTSDHLENLLASAGLSLEKKHPGSWADGSGVSFQDIAIARKLGESSAARLE